MDKRKKFTAVILLAGSGSRISDLTRDPKSLLKINNISLLIRNLKLIKLLNFKEVILVLGYKYKLILNEIKKFSGLKINYTLNENFKKFGNTYSLFLGLKKSKTDTIIFDGDLIYSKKILENFIFKGHSSSFLVGQGSLSNKECAKTLIDKKGNVKKTIDKRFIKNDELKKYKFIGEAVGIIKISKILKKKMIKNLNYFLKKKKNLKLNWEHFMNQFLVKNNIKYNKTFDNSWIEIDDKKDFIKAKKIFK